MEYILYSLFVLFLDLFFFFLKTVSVCSPGWPETHHARLASNSQGSPCLCLLSSELIKGVGHHTQLDIFYLK